MNNDCSRHEWDDLPMIFRRDAEIIGESVHEW